LIIPPLTAGILTLLLFHQTIKILFVNIKNKIVKLSFRGLSLVIGYNDLDSHLEDFGKKETKKGEL
jgi:hypothetical protein